MQLLGSIFFAVMHADINFQLGLCTGGADDDAALLQLIADNIGSVTLQRLCLLRCLRGKAKAAVIIADMLDSFFCQLHGDVAAQRFHTVSNGAQAAAAFAGEGEYTFGIVAVFAVQLIQLLQQVHAFAFAIGCTADQQPGCGAGILILGIVTVKVAVANGLGNARKIMEAIKSGEKDYTFVEVMSCPGGCINGGGQPYISDDVKNNVDVKKLRAQALYTYDTASNVRCSHDNEEVKALYKEFLGEPNSHKAHELLHTTYTAKPKY